MILTRHIPFIVFGLLIGSQAIFADGLRNVILCIGDGMGPEQVKAARYYAGTNLFFETLPYQSSMTTHCANNPVTDSGASATAMATGNKVSLGTISLRIPGDGSAMETLLEFFKSRGKATGLITTSHLTDATPAAFGAHTTNRYNFGIITDQYLNQTRPNVLFGGGGFGTDTNMAIAAGYTVVSDTNDLYTLDTESATFVAGVFGESYLPYEIEGLGELPHLHQMVEVALRILDNDPDGFFLLIEGARIDHGGHINDIEIVVHEVLEFDRSIQTARNWMAARDDTLLLVTADHETGGLNVLTNNGAGNYPAASWVGYNHSSTPVPVYATGYKADLATNVKDNTQIHSMVIESTLPDGWAFPGNTTQQGVQLEWVSTSGNVYRIEHSQSLESPNWATNGSYPATSSHTASAIIDTLSNTQMFFRVIPDTAPE